jgi:hypothetical protein
MKTAIILSVLFAVGFAFGMRQHHAIVVPPHPPEMDRSLKADAYPPDPHTFEGRLAITPGMFKPEDCNPAVVCPWGGQQRMPWWMQ